MGEIVWTDLPFGDSKVSVTSYGFATRRLVVTVRNSDEVKVDAKLDVGTNGETVLVEVDIEPLGELTHQLALPAPKMVAVPMPDVMSPPVEVAKPARPKRRWWQIFR